ncbi:MAG: ATP-binding protein, partial [Marmoricola sp.]
TQTRSMLGLLREQGTDPAAAPLQTIDDLEALVQDVRHAGVEVRLTVTGRRRPLDPGVELTVYRVVQESLTNVLKHSGATRALVELTYADDGVDICVRDSGRGGRLRSGAVDVAGGHGLVGLRERTRLLGGTLEYGPADGSGFRVRGHLPAPSVAP